MSGSSAGGMRVVVASPSKRSQREVVTSGAKAGNQRPSKVSTNAIPFGRVAGRTSVVVISVLSFFSSGNILVHARQIKRPGSTIPGLFSSVIRQRVVLAGFQTLLFVMASESLTDLAADLPPFGLRQEGQRTTAVALRLYFVNLSVNPALCPGWQLLFERFRLQVATHECPDQDIVAELGAAEAVKVW